jgi:hypothetical protein
MKVLEFRKLVREEVRKVIKESVAPVAKADLITKLAPLKQMFSTIKDNDIRSLTFVGNKAETTKIYKALATLGVQDYFDSPYEDEYSDPGTWIVDTMSADDNGLIKEVKKKK